MHAYFTYIRMSLLLTMREKSVIFFNYLFPLIFFYVFAFAFSAERGGTINMVFAMILVIGTLGNGLFGGGIRMVVEREANILRRFKVAPMSPLPILVASLVVVLITYLPSILLTFLIAKFQFGMHTPANWPALTVLVVVAVVAFRAIGLIIASVANSMGESTILTQLLYFPMMFLSGSTFPVQVFPKWLQKVTEFIPATHLNKGVQGMLVQNETLAQNGRALVALLLTTAVALFVAYRLFRWEKDEKLKPASKLWVLAALAPFFLVGAWELRSDESRVRQVQIDRKFAQSRTRLYRNARLIIGDGRVIERGGLLVRDGRIAAVYEGDAPDAKSVNADSVEAAGKTIIPGLIDAHVHLGAPGGMYANPQDYMKPGASERELAAYLYSGVTTVRSTGDWLDQSLALKRKLASNQYTGAELITSGPLFTAEGGHPTQMLKFFPSNMREQGKAQFVRIPRTADEARQMVRALKEKGVDLIKGVLESGEPGHALARLDVALLMAAGEEARRLGLPLAVHTGRAIDVEDALRAGVRSVEHGSMVEALPDELLKRLAAQGVYYNPTLSVIDGVEQFRTGKLNNLDFPLVQQVAPPGLIAGTKANLASSGFEQMRQGLEHSRAKLEVSLDNLRRAHLAGVPLVTGTDSGNMPLIHGPAIHRELQLWVKAGIPTAVALQAATGNAAKLLGISARTGTLEKGKEATLLVLDANPLAEIAATERISTILFKGERIGRGDLLSQEP